MTNHQIKEPLNPLNPLAYGLRIIFIILRHIKLGRNRWNYTREIRYLNCLNQPDEFIKSPVDMDGLSWAVFGLGDYLVEAPSAHSSII